MLLLCFTWFAFINYSRFYLYHQRVGIGGSARMFGGGGNFGLYRGRQMPSKGQIQPKQYFISRGASTLFASPPPLTCRCPWLEVFFVVYERKNFHYNNWLLQWLNIILSWKGNCLQFNASISNSITFIDNLSNHKPHWGQTTSN